MRYKKTIFLGSLFCLLIIIGLSTTILAFTGDVYPNDFKTPKGSLTQGTLDDFQEKDNDYLRWVGVTYGWFTAEFEVNIYFDEVSNVGTGNTLEWKYMFAGGGQVEMTITYYDNTQDTHNEVDTDGDYETKTYPIDDNKVVKKINLYNFEWWAAGALRIDYLAVHYN